MSGKDAELDRLIGICLQELRGLYSNEQSIRILLVVASIYYIDNLENDFVKNVQWGRTFQENLSVEWLDNRIKQLEYENEKLRGILTGLVYPFLPFSNNTTHRALETVMKNLNHFQFMNDDELVRLINLLAFKFVGDEVIHETPASITNLSLGLVHLESIRLFGDFCSGVSSVYLESFYRMKASGMSNIMFYYGEEINVSSYLISKLLMFVNQIPNFEIVNKDVLDLASREGARHTFDFIFSDAPFGVAWNPETARSDPRYEHGIPPRSSADWAFYQNVLYHLNPNGKAIVVGTKGTLVRSNKAHIRKSIIEKDLIEAIITLPENLYSKTSISTELIIFNKRKPENRTGKILFIDAGKYSYRIN